MRKSVLTIFVQPKRKLCFLCYAMHQAQPDPSDHDHEIPRPPKIPYEVCVKVRTKFWLLGLMSVQTRTILSLSPRSVPGPDNFDVSLLGPTYPEKFILLRLFGTFWYVCAECGQFQLSEVCVTVRIISRSGNFFASGQFSIGLTHTS
jgi:hypothetical protein